MRKLKKKWLSRALCGALAVALVSGAAVMTPIADFIGTNIIASAATYTGNVDASQLKNGDKLKAGACVQGWLTVYDENNNIIVNGEDHWSVYESDGKDYTINSITYDDFVGAYTIHVTSATVVSNAKELLTALAAGGEIKLANDISINQTVTISKACTIDFNGKKITFGGGRKDEYHLEVNAPTTLKNGTLTSSCTNDPRFAVLKVNSDTVAENMTISQPENEGAYWMVEVTSPKFTMIDSTITIATYSGGDTRGINVRNGGVLLFYGNNKINATDASFIGDSYFYSGTLETNQRLNAYEAKKVCFCGGAVKSTAGRVFNDLKSADYVILRNDGDDYAIYSDENCTVPMTAANAVSASAIYSKLNVKAEVDFSGLGDATITLTGRNSENIPLSNGKGTIIVGGKVTSSVPLKFTGAEVTETVNNNNYIYTIDSITGNTVTVKEGYIKEDTWWGLKKSGTLELFGTMPDDIGPFVYNGSKYYSPWGKEGYWSRSNIKKIVALPGAKAGKNSLYRLFFNHIEVTEIDLSNLDVSNAENMFGALQDCRKATTINLSGWDTSNVTNMGQMFYQCDAIQSLDLSHFNTSNVTDMQYMFSNCGLKSLNISNWNTSKVTNMFAMFSQSKIESTDNITGWANLDTSNVTNMQAMFNSSNFKKIDVSNFKTQNVTNMQMMFASCYDLESIVGLNKFDTSSLTSTKNMFAYLSKSLYDDHDNYLGSVTALKSVDLSSFNFSENVNMNSMFASTDVESIKVNDTFATTDDWNGPRLAHGATNTFIKGWFNENGEMVSGTGNYAAISGQSGTLTRRKYDFTQVTVSDISDYVHTGSAIEPDVTVKYGDNILTKGVDYKVTYTDNVELGIATATLTGMGEYGGTVTKNFAILPREMKASITNRRKIGNNAKVVLSSEWYLPKNATNIKAGIARLSTDDTNVTKYDVYNNGIKKASTLKTTSGKYSFSLLMNSTHANQNLYAVTYVTYEIDGKEFISLSNVFTSYANLVA